MNILVCLKHCMTLYHEIRLLIDPLIIRAVFAANRTFVEAVRGYGIPRIEIRKTGLCKIGKNLTIYSYGYSSLTGENRPSKIIVNKDAKLIIGNNVGMSSASIVCHNSVTIDDDVKIGGGVMIMDSDFHSLDPVLRRSTQDSKSAKTAPIHIGRNVFIGTASIILKGITIGENSIVGAGSVVTKSIPANEVWCGNPAKFIRFIA